MLQPDVRHDHTIGLGLRSHLRLVRQAESPIRDIGPQCFDHDTLVAEHLHLGRAHSLIAGPSIDLARQAVVDGNNGQSVHHGPVPLGLYLHPATVHLEFGRRMRHRGNQRGQDEQPPLPHS